MRAAAVALVTCTACASAERTYEAELPADGLARVFGDVERGNVGWLSDPAADGVVRVGARTWATGPGRSSAEARRDSSSWGFEVRGDLLDLWARSPEPDAGVDLVASGPALVEELGDVDVALVAVDGVAEAHGVRGALSLSGTSVFATDAGGPVDAVATAGIAQVEAHPREGDEVHVRSLDGEVWLALPRGLPLRLEVRADPAWGYDVVDLGFDRVERSGAGLVATAGDGSITVVVTARGGPLVVAELPGSPPTTLDPTAGAAP